MANSKTTVLNSPNGSFKHYHQPTKKSEVTLPTSSLTINDVPTLLCDFFNLMLEKLIGATELNPLEQYKRSVIVPS